MTTQYNVDIYTRGINSFGSPFCDAVFSATLAANTAASVTVPGASSVPGTPIPKYLAVFKVEAVSPVYMTINGTAAVPAGGTLAATNSELISYPADAKIVKAGDIISVITATANTDITIALYLYPAV